MWPDLGLLYGFKDILIQPFVPHCAIIAFDIGILLGLAGLDIFNGDAFFLGPLHEQAADIFRAVINSNIGRLAPPLGDLVQAAYNTHGRQREVDLDSQPPHD